MLGTSPACCSCDVGVAILYVRTLPAVALQVVLSRTVACRRRGPAAGPLDSNESVTQQCNGCLNGCIDGESVDGFIYVHCALVACS